MYNSLLIGKFELQHLCLVGATLQRGADDIVAQQINDGWQIGDQFLTRLDIRGPVILTFQNNFSRETRRIGPYSSLAIFGSYIMAYGKRLAYLAEEKDCWVMTDSGDRWHSLTLYASAAK